jgi:hypothetical protein
MKKCVTLLLALTVMMSLLVFPSAAISDDYDNAEFFEIDETSGNSGGFAPGQSYYFPCTWGDDPITDEFFDAYATSVSINSADTDEFSNSFARKCVDTAEFVRADNGEYYFLFRPAVLYSQLEDVDVIVAVFAKDRVDDDYRAWYEMDLTIEYSSAERNDVLDTEYDVDQNSPVLEFDDDLDSCRLNFSDDSYFNLKLTSTRVFNFGYSFEPNTIIADANPNAEMKFLSFYAEPKFASAGLLKIYAPGAQYLYEIGANGSLTRLSATNNSGYFGLSLNQLKSYVASDVLLKTSSGATPAGGSTSQSSSAAPSVIEPPVTSPPNVPINPQTGAVI